MAITYVDFEQWYAEWDEIFDEEDEDDMADLAFIRQAFQSRDREELNIAMQLLGATLSGCGGTENFIALTPEEYNELKDRDNAGLVQWAQGRDPNAHHSNKPEDWSDVTCSFYTVGSCYMLNTFMPG